MARSLVHKFSGLFVALLLVVSSLVALVPAPKAVAAPDCDANAVIYCGATSLQDLKNKYKFNQGGDLHAIFAHFGIPNEAAMDGMVMGSVTKNNEVFVGSQKVATGAVTAGRQRMTAHDVQVPNATAYMRPPSVSFRSNSLPALVKMDGTTFKFAVIMSCGNPVSAANRNVMPQPKPQPKPQPQPKPEEKPAMKIKKDVRVPGDKDWTQRVTTDPGTQLEYRITFTNTGNTTLKNVNIQDSLPQGITFVSENELLQGSTQVKDFTVADLVGEGVELDAVPADTEIVIQYVVRVTEDADGCDEPLVNTATAEADGLPEVDDDAEATVCQPDTPQVKPVVVTKPAAPSLPETGAGAALGIFSVTSILGVAAYKLKDFYLSILG